MSRIKKFLMQIPYLCDYAEPERVARIIELVYDDEIKNPGGPFAMNEKDKDYPANRFSIIFAFDGDPIKKEHCELLAELLFLEHYKKEHGKNEHDYRISEITSDIAMLENENPDIVAAMALSDVASASSFGWNS
jgi:hypothetical protein